jgi:hypothetical protein
LIQPALLGLILVFVSVASFAQTPGHKVKGTVSDHIYKEPIPGANILLVGTTIGTVTDTRGNFEFPQTLKEGDQLKFSSLGYQPITFTVGKETDEVLTVRIELDIEVLIETAVADPIIPKKKAWFPGIKDWF